MVAETFSVVMRTPFEDVPSFCDGFSFGRGIMPLAPHLLSVFTPLHSTRVSWSEFGFLESSGVNGDRENHGGPSSPLDLSIHERRCEGIASLTGEPSGGPHIPFYLSESGFHPCLPHPSL